MPEYELYGARACPYTLEMREWLDFKGYDYVEYDVDADHEALDRMLALSAGQRTVPVLVKDGRVEQVGWQGRGCIAGQSRA